MRAQERLEERVRERTRELTQANALLRREMEERARAEERARLQQEQLIQADKLVALGTLVSGVAHEINNPNNFIMLNAPVLQEAWSGALEILDANYRAHGDFPLGGLPYSEMRERVAGLCQAILEGARRIRGIVQELRDFARKRPAEFMETVNLNSAVKSALILVENQIRASTRRFHLELAEDLPLLRGQYQRLEQVVINLVQNACQALPDPECALRVATRHDPAAGAVLLEVQDEGVGMPPEFLKQAVDPFFTTRRDSGGTGLGLSICSGIINAHGGTLTIESQPDRGTLVRVAIPVADFETPPRAVL